MEIDTRLLALIERAERLLAERAGINDDIRDVFSEGKAVGYCAATMRRLIARRAMDPAERGEADAMLETYEAALGMGGSARYSMEELHPDAHALATAMLAEQAAAIDDPEQAAALAGMVLELLDIRAEIAALREQEGGVKARGKAAGFDPKQMGATVRWFEKCAKHGEDAMRGHEMTFRLYRATVEREQRRRSVDAATDDPRLKAALSPPPAKAPKKAVADAMVWAGLDLGGGV